MENSGFLRGSIHGIFVETGAGSTVSGTGGLYDLCTGWMGRHEPADACVYPGAYRARILENRPRPVLLNSWEACYFDISESRLLKLAKAGKDAGIELFVVDDGWFGRRNDDTSSLGDWVPNTKNRPAAYRALPKKLQIWGFLLESG